MKYVLTDFKSDRWKDINLESVKVAVDKFNERLQKIGVIFGELGHPTGLEISTHKVSHSIKSIELDNNKILGEVNFLDCPKGTLAKDLINECNFGLRGTCIRYENEIILKDIFTFDLIIK